MNIPAKQLSSGFEMPVYGLGTWDIGGGFSPNYSQDREEITTIRQAIEMGISHIDTAELYANGHAEEIIGEAIKGFDRERLLIVSKVWKTNLRYEDLLSAAHSSLSRLQTDYMDIYLIHAPNPSSPIKETMRAMVKLKKEGKIKEIGVSNFTKDQYSEAKSCTEHKIVNNQVHYNLQEQDPYATSLLEHAVENDYIATAYSPLAQGSLVSKGRSAVLDEMCKKYNKTPAQIAINWLISQKNVVTIAKTSNIAHLEENLGAIGWEMEEEDIERLREAFL